jgi:hypothetical protein
LPGLVKDFFIEISKMDFYRFSICFFLTVCLSLLFVKCKLLAQSPLDVKVLLHDKLEEIGAFKSLIRSFELKQGEEVLMNVESVGGRKLSRLIIEQPSTPFKMHARGIKLIERGSFVAARDGNYNFIFKNRTLLKNTVKIKLEKYPKKASRDTLVLDDIIVSTTIDTIRTAFADTTGHPDISAIELELQPALNYKSKSDTCLTEMLIDGEKYQFAVYWIGIGASARKEYENLKNNPPPSWSLKGINEPLYAYGLGLTTKLPESNSTIANSVKFSFKDPESNDKNINTDSKNPPTYGVIPVYKAGMYQKIRLCLKNFNTTTKAPIYILFAKYKLEKKEDLKIIKRERIQEIFIKKTYEFYETGD